MSSSPLISIIIPCYNVQEYLTHCVESVQNQTYRNIEIILIDDGSVDSTPKICDELAQGDSRIIVRHQANQGLSLSRNTGLSLASGEYIMFLDSDDWIDIQTCEDAICTATQYSADIVVWSYIREFSNCSKPKLLLGSEIKYYNCQSVSGLHRRIVGLTDSELATPEHADSLVTAWGKLYHRTVVEGISFISTSEIGAEDVYFNVLVFGNAQSIVYLPNCYHHYRKTNAASLSTAYAAKIFHRWKNLYKLIGEYLDEHYMPETFYTALNNRICLGLIGFGTNLAESNNSLGYKLKELRLVLNDEIYRKAIKQLNLRHFTFKWKFFFFFAKHRVILFLYPMLCIINFLRRN